MPSRQSSTRGCALALTFPISPKSARKSACSTSEFVVGTKHSTPGLWQRGLVANHQPASTRQTWSSTCLSTSMILTATPNRALPKPSFTIQESDVLGTFVNCQSETSWRCMNLSLKEYWQIVIVWSWVSLRVMPVCVRMFSTKFKCCLALHRNSYWC